jgi:cytochrome c-type biogenesis protein CcmH/NrfG
LAGWPQIKARSIAAKSGQWQHLASGLKFACVWVDSILTGNAFDKRLLDLYDNLLKSIAVHPGRKEQIVMKKGLLRSILSWLFILALLFFSLPSCASKEEKKAEHLRQAKQYVEKNELRKAVIELKNVVQLDPKNDEAYCTLGETYLRLKEGRDAFQAFSRAASVNPNNLEAQLKLGQIFLLGRNPEEATKKADLVLSKSPKNIDAMTLLAGIYVQKRDVDAAIKTLDEILTLDPDHFKTHLALGRLFLAKNEMEKAERADPGPSGP